MNNFKIGQKVVCIDDRFTRTNIKKDKIYSIKALSNCPGCGHLEVILEGVVLNEIGKLMNFVFCAKCSTSAPASNNVATWRLRPLKQEPKKITNVIDNKEVIKELVTEKSDVKIKEKV